MSRFLKTIGKLVTYLGFIASIWGIVNNNALGITCGIITIISGCVSHELNE